VFRALGIFYVQAREVVSFGFGEYFSIALREFPNISFKRVAKHNSPR